MLLALLASLARLAILALAIRRIVRLVFVGVHVLVGRLGCGGGCGGGRLQLSLLARLLARSLVDISIVSRGSGRGRGRSSSRLVALSLDLGFLLVVLDFLALLRRVCQGCIGLGVSPRNDGLGISDALHLAFDVRLHCFVVRVQSALDGRVSFLLREGQGALALRHGGCASRRQLRVAVCVALLEEILLALALLEDALLHQTQIGQQHVDAAQIQLAGVLAQVAAQRRQQALVDGAQTLDGVFANLKQRQVGKEIVSDKEAAENRTEGAE